MLAAGRGDEAGEAAQQGGLAAAGLAEQGEDLTGSHVEVDAFEDGLGSLGGVKVFVTARAASRTVPSATGVGVWW